MKTFGYNIRTKIFIENYSKLGMIKPKGTIVPRISKPCTRLRMGEKGDSIQKIGNPVVQTIKIRLGGHSSGSRYLTSLRTLPYLPGCFFMSWAYSRFDDRTSNAFILLRYFYQLKNLTLMKMFTPRPPFMSISR